MKDLDSTSKNWTELTFEIPASHADIVSHFLVSSLNRGVVIEDTDTELDGDHLDDCKSGLELVKIKAYISEQELQKGLLEELQSMLYRLREEDCNIPTAPVVTNEIQEEDWSQSWKHHFRPVRIGSKIIVKPTWETVVPKFDQIVIDIDPGMAFGTGDHATTRMVIEAMESLWPNFAEEKFQPLVLDIGTGTGVLSIVAARLGARRVLGVDIDPDAVVIAKENIVANGVSDTVKISGTSHWNASGAYDVIVANLDLNTLCSLSGQMRASLRSNGYMILSGILKEQVQKVLNTFLPLGLDCLCTKIDPIGQEWAALVLVDDLQTFFD